MDWYKSYKLVKDGENYTVVIELNTESAEFSQEFLTNFKESFLGLDEQIKKLLEEKFSDAKITSVKLMLGTLMVASIPFMSQGKVFAAEVAPTATTVQTSINTTVSSVTKLDTTGVVTATRLNMRSGPSTSYAIMHVLWQGNKVKVIGQSNGWYEIKLSDSRIGWVSGVYLQVDLRQQKIDLVLSTAKSLIGTPYVWGGNSLQAGGFDCSGFTEYVFSKAGYTLNRISADQGKQGTAVSRQNLLPGDLVFFSIGGTGIINHVGIYIGNGQMIHSPKAGDTVKITDISTSYWQNYFVTGRRIF